MHIFMKVIQHSIHFIFIFAHLHCESYKLLKGRQFISHSRLMKYKIAQWLLSKLEKSGKKSLKSFLRENSVTSHKMHPDPTAFNFSHAAPLPNTPTASSVNADRKQTFLYPTMVTRMPGITYLKINVYNTGCLSSLCKY
jgi:hypothetical protein